MKKKISILAIVLATILCIVTRVNGADETKKVYTEEINPIYASENIAEEKVSTFNKNFTTTNGSEYISNKNTIAKSIRDNLIKRNSTFGICAQIVLTEEINDDNYGKYINEVVNMAISEDLANSSSAGDYLRYSLRAYRAPAKSRFISKKNGKYTYNSDITFDFTYFTTSAQEKELNGLISSFVKANINKEKDSKYKKICTIYDYITANVSYDYTNLNNTSYVLKYSAYAALKNKTAVCQGYATLLYKMLKEAGVGGVRVVTNDINHVQEGHSWNIINIGDLYYNVDATWDANYNYGNGNIDYKYFLKGINTFNKDENHRLGSEFRTAKFRTKYKISNIDYEQQFTNSKVTGFKLKNNYTNKVTLKWNKQNDIHSYQIYQYNSENGKYDIYIGSKGENTTTITIKKLSVATTYKFAIRATTKVRNQTLNGAYAYLKVTTKPSKVTISKVKSSAKKKMTIKWKKVSSSSGYYIEYSTNSKFKKMKKIQIKSKKTISKTIKKLKRNKKYYIRIRAYKTVDNKKVYGDYSKAKSIRVK